MPEKPNYRIMRQLGRGTFGKVYLAVDSKEDRLVAIKRTVKWKSCLSREAEYARELSGASENIVDLENVIYTKTPAGYLVQNLVMEYIESSLGTFLRNARTKRTAERTFRLPASQVKSIGKAVVVGLSEMHVRGLAHRDLKPDNVMLDVNSNGCTAKICDFGSTKKLTDGDPHEKHMPYICSRCVPSQV